MPVERIRPADDREGHPWEHLEQRFELMFKPEQRSTSMDDAAREVFDTIVRTAASFIGGRRRDYTECNANDVSQEWWLGALDRRFAKYDRRRPYHPYGFSALRWACRESLRSRAHNAIPGLACDLPDDRQNPVRDGQRRELRVIIGRALRKLPKLQRQAVVLLYWKGLTLAEAARRQGCSEGAMDTRACRGRKKLRRLLAGLADYFQK